VLDVHIGRHPVVGRLGREVRQLDEVAGTRLEGAPGGDVLAQRLRFAQDLLSLALVVPEAGLRRERFELREASLACG
jgi:hypothetical protein